MLSFWINLESRNKDESLNFKTMNAAVREVLKKHPDLPRSVKNFELSDHEKDVLSAFQILKENASPPANVNVAGETWQQYRKIVHGNENILGWTLLLHDISKNRGMDEPHPGQGGEIIRFLRNDLQEVMDASKEELDRLEWLVQYHDVLGNMNTGERFPDYLDVITSTFPEKERDFRLNLLQVVTFCDVMGTSGGAYLSDAKAKFWRNLSFQKFRDTLQKDILDFRIRRWTGNLQTLENPERAEQLRVLILENQMEGLFQQIYGKQVFHVMHGIYLFTALSEINVELLFQLLRQSAMRCLKLFPSESEIQLAFESYKPWEKNAPRLLKRYQKLIQDTRLKFSQNKIIGRLEVKV